MRSKTLFSLFLLAGAVFPAHSDDLSGGGAMFRGDLGRTAAYRTAALHRLPEVRWRFVTEGPVRSSPVVVAETVYVGSGDGNLYAVDLEKGTERWRFRTGGAVDSSPAVAGGLVYLTSRDRTLYAVDAATGQQRWRFVMAEEAPFVWGWDYFLSSPVVADGTVYVGGGDGHLYAVDAASGVERWRFATGGRVRSSPAIADGTVYVGSMDGHLYAVDAATGDERWRFATEGAGFDLAKIGFDRTSVSSSPAVSGDTVLVGGRDGFLYAVDRATGNERWRVDHEVSWVMASPAVASGRVLVGTSDGLFFQAVDLETGAEQWRFETRFRVHSSAAVADGVVYFGSHGGRLQALDAASGDELWQFRSGAQILSSPSVADGVVTFGDDSGRLYALTGETTPAPERPALARAVYYQEFAEKWFQDGSRVRDDLEAEGYDVLDGAGLMKWLEERLRARQPSVVVFAVDRIPEELGVEPSTDHVLRRYMEAGGKVVWMGLWPFAMKFENGKVAGVDPQRGGPFLDMELPRPGGDVYGAQPTPTGRRWGIDTWWNARGGGAAAEQVSTVLAVDGPGRAVVWVKNFGGGEGSGFVYLGSGKTLPFDLGVVQAVAEYRP